MYLDKTEGIADPVHLEFFSVEHATSARMFRKDKYEDLV